MKIEPEDNPNGELVINFLFETGNNKDFKCICGEIHDSNRISIRYDSQFNFLLYWCFKNEKKRSTEIYVRHLLDPLLMYNSTQRKRKFK